VNMTTFEDRDGRTVLTTLVECPSKEIRDAIVESGMEGDMLPAHVDAGRRDRPGRAHVKRRSPSCEPQPRQP